MAFWGNALKADLQKLADNFGVEIGASATIIEIKKAIQAIPNYDEEVEYIRELLETLKAKRLEEEKKKLEREEKRIAAEEKRIAKEREAKRILEEKELENAFQLKKLQLELENKSRPSETVPMAKPKLEMRHLMQKVDPREGDISLYLVLFERQARRVEINEDLWVSHLIGLLPYEMSQLIARESEEVSNDYSHIKKLLLKSINFRLKNLDKSLTTTQKVLTVIGQTFCMN
ncbi:hypothetical protein AVEN_120899-1 [Araneus ventricosus]|uniref:Uncharacterized protein n=1 Tax=Araneus ventricosus TaxID=182803 RepID=A0A4Y2JIP6_ARAVE|nr:hypothetical protein AVEN_120899-1 [Araneus ventricosus]